MSYITIEDLPPLERLSFSAFWEMRTCAMRGWPGLGARMLKTNSKEVTSRAAVLGLFYHDLLNRVGARVTEGVSRDDTLAALFPEVLGEFKTRYPWVDFDYLPIVEQIYQTILLHLEFPTKNSAGIFREERFESTDGLLFGYPDLVVHNGGEVTLVDYKLTTHMDRLVTDRNVAQLDFYSYLIWESLGEFPSSSMLVGLLGLEHSIKPEEGRVNSLARDMKRLLREVKSRRQEQCLRILVNPTEKGCRTCKVFRECMWGLQRNSSTPAADGSS